ncbi:MAG: GreA/GreB family elongation factor [bacterium]
MEILNKAKTAISESKFTELEDIWTEMILAQDIELSHFFEICDTLKKTSFPERVLPLLEMLAEQCEAEKAYAKALDVCKKMVYFSDQDKTLRKRIIDLYKKIFDTSAHLSEYLDISGLNNNDPIFKAIAKLEQFLEYDVGRYFYFERYGFGEVVDTIPQKREIVVDFEKKKRHFLSISIAQGILTPLTEGSFLHNKYTDIQSLKKMSRDNPEELIKMILRDSSEPLNASQIRAYLDGILERKQISKWWEKQRKKIEQNKNIKVSGRGAKQYSYIRSDQDKSTLELAAFKKANTTEKYLLATTYVKKEPALFCKIVPELVHLANEIYKSDPGPALDILMLCQDSAVEANFAFSMATVINDNELEPLINNLQSIEHKKSILAFVRKQEKEWVRIFKDLMLTIDDPSLFAELANNLESAPGALKDIHYTVLSSPKKYPAQYLWMLKSMLAGELAEYSGPSFLPRLIASVDYVKGIRGTVLKILNLDTYDKIIAQADSDEAKRILEAINMSMGLPDYKKKDFARIIEFHHPDLFTRTDDVIYTTKQALKKKQDELEHIMNVAIPENKKEISRAREYGDLSENFEYKAARERQEQFYSKLRAIESQLGKTQIIVPQQITTDHVCIGSKVTVENVANGEQSAYTILGRWDTDLEKNIISNEAPVAQALLGRIPGEKIIINKILYEIVRIEKGLN